MTEEDANMRFSSYYLLCNRTNNGTVPTWQLTRDPEITLQVCEFEK
jgi:hypothetical protein